MVGAVLAIGAVELLLPLLANLADVGVPGLPLRAEYGYFMLHYVALSSVGGLDLDQAVRELSLV